ncbi:uncharacterized protein LOC143634055 [Bidens hawaiensis]|uniref:uncharacterized protein LOC143634055 n=1 Tax=Bidens hawaiensis TaxID=980011 RepID=UPI00404ACCBB
MVVIESADDTTLPPQPSNSTDSVNGDKATTTAGYASDGYETASETELGDGADNNNNNNNNNNNDDDKPHEHQPKDQTYEDALNDDELKQKILVQMNEAKVEGNKLYGEGLYEEALLKYDYAIQLAPEMPSSSEVRSICHNNRATCFFKLGKYEDTVKECSKALELNPTYLKALIRRGEAHEKLENYDEAIPDMKKILELDPSNNQCRRTIFRLEPLAIEKREKMKEEMLGKLKDMGNSILGRFGMSVDNFKAVKDPNTGSYSISFQR